MDFRTPPRSRIREGEDIDRVAALVRDIRHLEYLVRQASLNPDPDVQTQALGQLAEEDLRRKREELMALAPMAALYPPDQQSEPGASGPQTDEVVELEAPPLATNATPASASPTDAPPTPPRPRTLAERIKAIQEPDQT